MVRKDEGRRGASLDSEVVDVGLVAEREVGALVARPARTDAARRLDLRRFAARQQLDGVENLDVAGAPAQVRAEMAGRVTSRKAAPFAIEQRLRAHHDSRRAETALERATGPERPCEAIAALRWQSFHCVDRLPAILASEA